MTNLVVKKKTVINCGLGILIVIKKKLCSLFISSHRSQKIALKTASVCTYVYYQLILRVVAQ